MLDIKLTKYHWCRWIVIKNIQKWTFDTTQYTIPWANKRNSIATFKDLWKFVVVKESNQSMTLQVNENIIGAFLSYSRKSGRAVDFEMALKSPLSAAPLSIVNEDGSRWETSKIKLMDIINRKGNENSAQGPSGNHYDFVIDFTAVVQTLTVIPRNH